MGAASRFALYPQCILFIIKYNIVSLKKLQCLFMKTTCRRNSRISGAEIKQRVYFAGWYRDIPAGRERQDGERKKIGLDGPEEWIIFRRA